MSDQVKNYTFQMYLDLAQQLLASQAEATEALNLHTIASRQRDEAMVTITRLEAIATERNEFCESILANERVLEKRCSESDKRLAEAVELLQRCVVAMAEVGKLDDLADYDLVCEIEDSVSAFLSDEEK